MAGDKKIVCDALLVAVGRRPNVEGLGLEKAGVNYTEHGIQVNDHLRTSQSHIYAAGGYYLLPDGRAVPFCAYNNLGYRQQVKLEQEA